jgi:Ca2+-binding EF-hand superfamily protein
MSGMSAIGCGQQSSASIAAFQNNLFSKIDTDSNGQISPDELAAFGQNLPGASGTGQSGTSSNSALFNQIDTNGDGSITKDELNAYMQQQAQTRAALLQLQEDSGVKPKHHHHHGSSGSGQTQSPDPTAIFNTLDTNQDGSVSATEWAAAFGTNGSANVSASTQSADNNSINTLLETLNKLV